MVVYWMGGARFSLAMALLAIVLFPALAACGSVPSATQSDGAVEPMKGFSPDATPRPTTLTPIPARITNVVPKVAAISPTPAPQLGVTTPVVGRDSITMPIPSDVFPSPMPKATEPYVGQLTLGSYRRIDSSIDPKGGSPVYIVDQDTIVLTQVRGIKQLDVAVTLTSRDTAAKVSGLPDASGEVRMHLHLPRVGEIYIVQAAGVLADQQRNQGCAITNERNECILPAQSALRVKAEL